MWPWILAAVIVFALLFWFLRGRGETPGMARAGMTDSARVADGQRTGMTDPVVMGAASGTLSETAVVDFVRFADGRASRTAGVAHEYTADGLRQLAAALNEIVGRDSVSGVALEPRINEIRDRANVMQQDPNATDHAQQAREAFSVAASLMAQMNTMTVTTNDSGRMLRDAAMAIQPSVPLLQQTERVEEFFTQAAKALRTPNS